MSKDKIYVGHRPTKRKQRIFWIAASALVILSLIQLKIDLSFIREGLQKIPNIMGKMANVSWEIMPQALDAMVLTLAIALIGVIISAVISFIIAFLIAENTAPNRHLRTVLSSICIVIRTIPITVWVLLAVASAGFGATAAVLGLVLPTIAYLSKTFANQIETSGTEVKETMRSLGVSWPVMIIKGFVPICITSLIALIAFRFEMSVSESTALGMVGCGGIGFMISKYIKAYKFGELTCCIIVVLITMFALEMGTAQIRKKMKRERNE